MDTTLPMLAGMVSTAVFVGSVLPMLHKALRTRELSSYSFGNIALANVGNAVHSVYVFHLPPGPIWVLHSFYVVSSALMLYWYLRGARARSAAPTTHLADHAPRPVSGPLCQPSSSRASARWNSTEVSRSSMCTRSSALWNPAANTSAEVARNGLKPYAVGVPAARR